VPIGLDHADALDLERVGAKASRLAAARRAGLNVLDGIVIETAHSRPFLSAAEDVVRDRGQAAGRLAMMDIELAPELIDSVRDALDCERFVVRSSSPLEDGGEWSGAFASYVDVDPGSLETAVRGCWASMLGRDALERFERVGGDPAATGMAVLVQPFITPSPGGVAEVDDGGVHITVADDGELAGLLQGWARGSRAELPRTGAVTGPAVRRHGAPLLEQVGDLARACRERVGDDHLEWAFSDGCCYLLQSRQTGTRRRAERRRPPPGLAGADAARIAWTVARYGGESGDELVLPWCLAPGGLSSPVPDGVPASPERTAALPSQILPSQILPSQILRSTARALAAQAWQTDEDSAAELARAAIARLRDRLDPRAVAEFAALAPVDGVQARRILATVEGAAAAQVRAERLFHPADAWRLPPAALGRLVDEASLDAQTLAPPAGAWEAFVHETVLANGSRLSAEPACPGLGAGRLLVLEGPRRLPGIRERWILHVTNPLPAFAPLLWGAAGLISATGSPSAHLFDVARTLGVPAVAGVDLTATSDGAVVAVDGSTGNVAVLSQPALPRTASSQSEEKTTCQ
jgi:phosphohistidine swiveling domain-containing protein